MVFDYNYDVTIAVNVMLTVLLRPANVNAFSLIYREPLIIYLFSCVGSS